MWNQDVNNDGGIAAFGRAAALKHIVLESPGVSHYTIMAMLSGPAMQLTRLQLSYLGVFEDSPWFQASVAASATCNEGLRTFLECRVQFRCLWFRDQSREMAGVVSLEQLPHAVDAPNRPEPVLSVWRPATTLRLAALLCGSGCRNARCDSPTMHRTAQKQFSLSKGLQQHSDVASLVCGIRCRNA